MIEYIVVVSTVDKDPYNHQVSNNKREQFEIETYLRRRSLTMQVLDKEAIPRLPDLVDIPRHLAVITSAVIRHSVELQARPKPYDPADQKLGEVCSKCMDVEEQALLRVSKLKAKTSGHQITFPLGPNSHRSPRSPMRPSTAPSPINFNSPFCRPFPRAVHNPDYPGSQHARVHLTSTSTDSIPSYGLSSQLIDTDPTSRRVRELFNLKNILRR
ncbi:hypothetical protein C0993_009676 [Termitomyces sp. T159_Od127]|nr:hypothetical protein C0993_009676 [Termitomyces sp. T159_Od127]